MTTEICGNVTPPLSRRETAACEQLLAAMVDALRRRLPMTLELVGVELELARSELAVELIEQAARRRVEQAERRRKQRSASGGRT